MYANVVIARQSQISSSIGIAGTKKDVRMNRNAGA